MTTSSPAPDAITLDGRRYLAYGFGDALDLAADLTTDTDSLNVIATLRQVDLDTYVPDYTSSLDFGPNRDKGIDWANADFYIKGDDNGDHSAADLAAVLLKDGDPFVRALGANLQLFTQKHLCPTTHQDARIVVRRDGSVNLDDIDLNNVLTWR